jgi:hypothetical protein
VAEATSLPYVQNSDVALGPPSPRLTDASAWMGWVGQFRIPRHACENQERFGLSFGPSGRDRLLEANQTYTHHRRKKSVRSVWTSTGECIARAGFVLRPMRRLYLWGCGSVESRMVIVACDQGSSLACASSGHQTTPLYDWAGFHGPHPDQGEWIRA